LLTSRCPKRSWRLGSYSSCPAGACQIKLYSLTPTGGGPNLLTTLNCTELSQGTHYSPEYTVDVELDEGELVGTYYAVVFATETATDGNSNRDKQPKHALQHGITDLTEIAVEIITPNENPVSNNNFCFDDTADPDAECDVPSAGTTGDQSEDDELQWTFTTMPGSTLSFEPGPPPPSGPSITWTYTRLPSDNSAFGLTKTLTLHHPAFPLSDFQDVEIFFPRDEANHPGPDTGDTRNWYYYWQDGNVVSDLTSFEYANEATYGYYDASTDTLYVGNAAPTQNDGPTLVTNKDTQQEEEIGADGAGIDCCAETASHELEHQWIYKNLQGQDTDGDGLPDAFEIANQDGYNFDPAWPDTYDLAGTIHPKYFSYGDNEFLARKAEQEPGETDPSNDWSDANGKNWDK